MTDGQRAAVEQLRDVEDLGRGSFEVLNVEECTGRWAGRVRVDLSFETRHLRRSADGLPLRNRERVIVLIPPGFPFDHPAVLTPHQRFAGFPHVQWTRHLCLYQAPNTEWDASDGMFGFLSRLEDWFRHGAVNELDPTGAPLHPPVAYATSGHMVIPRANTPTVTDTPWLGLGHLRLVSDHRVDVIGWSDLFSKTHPDAAAAAILLAEPMPFEFPGTVAELLEELERRGVSRRELLLTLELGVLHNADDAPLYVIVGTPMRGTQGADRHQHLSAWYLEPWVAKGLRIATERYSNHEELRDIGERAEQIIWEWATQAEMSWCMVREQRDEIVRRRDHDAPVAWFKGRAVALWGCGALGGHLGLYLARAGVAKLVLRDEGIVAPGLLVRQPYDDADIGRSKVDSLAEHIHAIDPAIIIETNSDDLLDNPLGNEQCLDDVELIIDTTGSRAVLKKIESRWQRASRRVPIASLVVGARAERGIAVLALSEHSGGPADVVRLAKLAACSERSLADWRDGFWPPSGREGATLFQPEPGCSDPTFVGSAADVAVIAGVMLNHVAKDLGPREASAFAHFVEQAHLSDGHPSRRDFRCQPERVLRDVCAGYEVRISAGAWESMIAQIRTSQQRRGARVETGGVLFGERDDACGVIWVTDASGPPADSKASAAGFECGTAGTSAMNREKGQKTYGAVQFVGMWHTHPHMTPDPSRVDLSGMAQIVTSLDPPIAKALMIIVGHTPDRPTPAAYVFGRRDFRLIAVGSFTSSPDQSWMRRSTLRHGLDITKRFVSLFRREKSRNRSPRARGAK
jgi:integrative and conjugative element protein (TIGR02256 family)